MSPNNGNFEGIAFYDAEEVLIGSDTGTEDIEISIVEGTNLVVAHAFDSDWYESIDSLRIICTLETPATPATPTGEDIVCTLDEETYSTSAVATATAYEWRVEPANAATLSGSTTTSETITWSTSGEVSVRCQNADELWSEWSTAIAVSAYLPPIADFEFAVDGLAVDFTNTSTNDASWAWTFGDGNTSMEENPSHDYVSYNSYLVSLTASNLGCPSEKVTKSVNIPTGINTLTNKIKIFPNPAKDLLNVTGIDGRVSIVNVLGQVVLDAETGKIDVSGLRQGTYFVSILTETGKIFVQKLIIK